MIESDEPTLKEHCVLGVLMVDQPRGFRELQDAFERRYGTLIQLNAFELKAILARLESLGLIERVEY